MKYLITGCNGFVGSYLIPAITDKHQGDTIVGVDVGPSRLHESDVFKYASLNMLDSKAIDETLEKARPDYIIHLASMSSVGYSWQHPTESFTNNTNIFLNLLESVRVHCPEARILSIGSSEEYGKVSKEELPLSESSPLRPVSPYAVARIAQEHLSIVYSRGFGLNVVCTRSFNHIGPGQSDQFVVSSIAKKLLEHKKGKISKVTVGDTSIVRDFLDVQDVVRAYLLLLEKGISAEIYNICKGTGYSINEVIGELSGILGIVPVISADPSLMRPAENPIVIGDNSKIRGLGWEPRYELKESLESILAYWESRI
jgi:GDP-4-dehydro-6-deoxy-D-mannose reductase